MFLASLFVLEFDLVIKYSFNRSYQEYEVMVFNLLAECSEKKKQYTIIINI